MIIESSHRKEACMLRPYPPGWFSCASLNVSYSTVSLCPSIFYRDVLPCHLYLPSCSKFAS